MDSLKSLIIFIINGILFYTKIYKNIEKKTFIILNAQLIKIVIYLIDRRQTINNF